MLAPTFGVKEAIEITIRGYFDKHPRDVVLFLISQESAAIDIHSASDEWLYTPTMAQAIPHPSILDDFEYLGAFNGEQRWRSDGGARLYTWDSLHGEIEVFNRPGKHLGAMDPKTERMTKAAVAGRKIDV